MLSKLPHPARSKANQCPFLGSGSIHSLLIPICHVAPSTGTVPESFVAFPCLIIAIMLHGAACHQACDCLGFNTLHLHILLGCRREGCSFSFGVSTLSSHEEPTLRNPPSTGHVGQQDTKDSRLRNMCAIGVVRLSQYVNLQTYCRFSIQSQGFPPRNTKPG